MTCAHREDGVSCCFVTTRSNSVRVDPEVVQCKSWRSFGEELAWADKGNSRIYRGQRDPSWRLESAWEREVSSVL